MIDKMQRERCGCGGRRRTSRRAWLLAVWLKAPAKLLACRTVLMNLRVQHPAL